MVAPEGCSAHYWWLWKGLYGLWQAGRQWYLTLHKVYLSLGFSRCESDWSIYSRWSATSISFSATSVNDLLLTSNSKIESDLAATQIQNKFAVTDGGNTKWLLGCCICQWRNSKLLTINQEQFTAQILAKFHMEHSNTVKTPCPNYHLTLAMCPLNAEQREAATRLPFCALIRKCMYLANCTRPDISFTIHKLAKFMSNYGTKHFKAAKHLLRYLQGTQSQGLMYRNSLDPYPLFKAFANSDWAMSKGCKSISSFLIECGGSIIAWSSKQQVIMALSSCEAEYIACSHCAWQILWQWSLFTELGYHQPHTTPLYCDNQGTIACTHDPQSHSCMKHINIRAHFIRDTVNQQLIDVHHIPGIENPADLMTKPLQCTIHLKWLTHISMNKDTGPKSMQITRGCWGLTHTSWIWMADNPSQTPSIKLLTLPLSIVTYPAYIHTSRTVDIPDLMRRKDL